MADANDVIVQIFGEEYEFWRHSTGETFRDCAQRLLDKGLTVDETSDILGELWNAVSEEYGG